MGKRKLKTTACILPVDEAFLQRMIYRAAVFSELCEDGKTYDKMPENVKRHFSLMEYREIIRPLIIRDHKRGYSVLRMSSMYRMTYSQVRYIVENFAKD